MTSARGEHSATPLRTGKILVAGGVSTLNQAEVYDPGLNSWAATGNLNIGRYRHTATLLGDGQVLVAGSVTNSIDGKTSETYDPSSGAWTRAGDLVTNRYDHSASLLPCGEVVVSGGESSSGVVLRSSERFHPVSRQWRSTSGSLITGRWSHTSTLLYDGRVLVTGGWNGGTLASAEIFDPATDTWSATGSMATPRYRHTATLLPNGKVLVAGGWNGGSLASAELYDPAAGLFTATGAMATARDSHTALLLPNGKVLVAGGFGTATAALYDPATGTWTSTASLSKARDEHTMTLLATGRVLVAGGTNPAPDAETELYDVGRGESPSFRPVIGSVTDPWVDGSPISVTGTAFQGVSEASSGIEGRNSATNYPLVQIQRLDNEAVFFVPVRPTGGWTNTSFLSPSMSALVPGPAQVTVFTNGIPSVARNIGVECGAPVATVSPASQSVCEGGTANFTAATTAECPAYQWRFSGTPLSDSGRISGSQAQALTINSIALSDEGDYDVIVSAACSSMTSTSATASLTVVPPLGPNIISVGGATTVCTSCTGGVATESHSGGGASTYQWGFRTVSLGAITDIPGETGSSYVINGGHFPGPGTYFLVARTIPTCGTTQTSNEITVTVNDIVPTDTVQFFTITSKDGENVLEWVYPAGFGTVRVSVRQGSPGCTFPNDPLDPTTFLSDETGAPGGRDLLTHSSLTNDVFYCYTLFVDLGGGTYSAGRSNRGYPLDTSFDVKWAYSVGTTSMAPPGLGSGVVFAVANDNAIHSMVKGVSGGTWPATWKPKAMMGPSQGRPVSIGVTASGFNPVIFLSSQDGHAYAFSAASGDQAWMSPPLGSMVTGAPSGMFVLFGGANDRVYVGSRDSGDNTLYALDASNGSIVWQYSGEPLDKIGIVTGQAAVDYANDRIYFGSFERSAGASTLWAMKPDGTRDWGVALGSVFTGVAQRGSTLYVGSIDSKVHSVDVSGVVNWSISTGDGVVKGYVAPDRFTDDIYLSSNTTVRRLSDDGSPPSTDWSRNDIPSPSTPVYSPGDAYLYLGSGDGKLYQLEPATGATIRSFPLGDQGAGVGSPTLDLINRFVYVGTEAGVIYAIKLP